MEEWRSLKESVSFMGAMCKIKYGMQVAVGEGLKCDREHGNTKAHKSSTKKIIMFIIM